jgi:hypothetical protein
MNEPMLIIGILLGASGAIALGVAFFDPESVRREKRRVRTLAHKARSAGLRGRYKFADDRSMWDATSGFGTYEPADSEDRELYAAVGSRIEGESEFFAKEMLWTDARLLWAGIPALLIGAAACAASVLG